MSKAPRGGQNHQGCISENFHWHEAVCRWFLQNNVNRTRAGEHKEISCGLSRKVSRTSAHAGRGCIRILLVEFLRFPVSGAEDQSDAAGLSRILLDTCSAVTSQAVITTADREGKICAARSDRVVAWQPSFLCVCVCVSTKSSRRLLCVLPTICTL